MKKLALSLILGIGVLSASPTPTTTSVYLTSAPTGVISPYTMSINGITTAALCIDPDDTSYLGPDNGWNAYVSNVNGSLTHTYQDSKKVYEEEAYIFSQITKPGISAQTQLDLQIADWTIADPGFLNESDNEPILKSLLAGLTNADYQAISTDVAAAAASEGYMNYSYYQIVSDSSDDKCRNQEFMIDATPEPATYALFGLAFLIAGAVRQFARRKAAANQ